MLENEKIESRAKEILLLEKMKSQSILKEALAQEACELFSSFMILTRPPLVDISVNKNGGYKIKIEAEASEIYKQKCI